MPEDVDIASAIILASQRAVAMLATGKDAGVVLGSVQTHFPGLSSSQVSSVMENAQSARSAINPLGSRGRYRVSDIPQIGSTPTEVDQISPNARYTARGIATWIDPVTGREERSTVYFRYRTLPSKSRIEADLRRQAIHQQRDTRYPGKEDRTFDVATLEIDFVALTRSY